MFRHGSDELFHDFNRLAVYEFEPFYGRDKERLRTVCFVYCCSPLVNGVEGAEAPRLADVIYGRGFHGAAQRIDGGNKSIGLRQILSGVNGCIGLVAREAEIDSSGFRALAIHAIQVVCSAANILTVLCDCDLGSANVHHVRIHHEAIVD